MGTDLAGIEKGQQGQSKAYFVGAAKPSCERPVLENRKRAKKSEIWTAEYQKGMRI